MATINEWYLDFRTQCLDDPEFLAREIKGKIWKLKWMLHRKKAQKGLISEPLIQRHSTQSSMNTQGAM